MNSRLSLLLSASLLFTACSSPVATSGRFRAVHASSDAPNVNVLLDGTPIFSDLAFGSGTAYASAKAGAHALTISAVGSSTPVISASLNLAAGQDYTVLAVGKLASPAPLVLTDNNAAPSTGKLKLRFVHAASSAPTVDVYVTAPGANLATATPLVTALSFKSASSYLEIAPGSYQLRITSTGTKTVAIDTGAATPITLSAGQIRTAVALEPKAPSTTLTALLLTDR